MHKVKLLTGDEYWKVLGVPPKKDEIITISDSEEEEEEEKAHAATQYQVYVKKEKNPQTFTVTYTKSDGEPKYGQFASYGKFYSALRWIPQPVCGPENYNTPASKFIGKIELVGVIKYEPTYSVATSLNVARSKFRKIAAASTGGRGIRKRYSRANKK